jgi:hypothetical protein
MAKQLVLLGSSTQTPVENKTRHVVVLPGQPSKDFILTARCRIMNVGGRITMSATDMPGDSGGIYTWTTTSNKIRLLNTTGNTLAIEALASPGSARDSETITVTRTGIDGVKMSKTVSLTVARVTFHSSSVQRYGYDDFDTSLIQSDDHVSVKSGGDTYVAVKIEGGATGKDFDFVSDPATVCEVEPAPEAAEFNLHVQAKSWQKKAAVLRARVKCPAVTVFAEINVHVYAEKVVKVLVAKVANTAFPATALKYPTADYAAHQQLANDKLREGVVKFELKNFDSGNAITNVDFGKNVDGALIFDINASGGLEFDLIDRALTSSDADQYRVAIVKDMKSYYYLDRPAKKGDASISVRGTNIFKSKMVLGKGGTMEIVEVLGNVGNVGSLAHPLAFDHAIGEALEFAAAAWSSDPIVICEGNASLDEAKWTILHEVGHSALELQDIVDPTNFMNFEQGNTDFRLRYCPRDSEYNSGVKENQWEKIPRPLPKPPSE